jgi:hypothetical protein
MALESRLRVLKHECEHWIFNISRFSEDKSLFPAYTERMRRVAAKDPFIHNLMDRGTQVV